MRNGIVIGEGVVLDARPASFPTRMLATGIDVVVLAGAGVGVTLVIQAILGGRAVSQRAGAVLTIVLIATVLVAIPTAVETLSRGRSLGRLAMGIRIVRDDGGPVRLRQALVRALVGIGELWMTAGAVAIVVSALNDRGRRVGDYLAGTYAIRVRGGRSGLAPLAMPPRLAGWAARADLRRLPDDLALASRRLLARAGGLSPDARLRLSRDLAARVEAFVAPSPPEGTPPEEFLAAVLAGRREREWAAVQRDLARDAGHAAALRRLPHEVPDPR